MVTSPLTDDALDEIEAGCEGVQGGPWIWRGKSSSLHRQGARPYTFGEAVLAPTYDYDSGVGIEIGEAAAAHIARLDPATILSLIHEIREARTARAAVQPVTEEALRFEINEYPDNCRSISFYAGQQHVLALNISETAELAATLSSPAPSVEGWVLVPREPTEAMRQSAFGAYHRWPVHEEVAADHVTRLYRAMLAAAPASGDA